MRAYVITDTLGVEHEDSTTVVGVVSSRKSAIDTCEDYMGRTSEEAGIEKVINWERKDKHSGHAIGNGHVVSYQMFFVNQVDLDE